MSDISVELVAAPVIEVELTASPVIEVEIIGTGPVGPQGNPGSDAEVQAMTIFEILAVLQI